MAYYAPVARRGAFGRVAEAFKILRAANNERKTTMNKLIVQTVKYGLVAVAAAVALTGCCLTGSDKNCCGACCKSTSECCSTPKPCDGKKTSGMNTSMTLGIGTDGVSVGTTSNAGRHNMSANAGVSTEGGKLSAEAGGGMNR